MKRRKKERQKLGGRRTNQMEGDIGKLEGKTAFVNNGETITSFPRLID